MSKSYDDYVNVLNDDEFDSLIESINKRIDKKKYGETNFEDLAIKYGRKPVCPKCGSKEYINDGYTRAGHNRYRCKECNCSYTLLSNESNKIKEDIIGESYEEIFNRISNNLQSCG